MMHSNFPLFKATLLILFGATTLITPAPAWPEIYAENAAQVVEKNIAARGGPAAWKAINTIAFVGKIDAGRTHPEPVGTVDNPPDSRSMRRLREKTMQGKTPEEAGTVIALPYRMELKRPRKVRVELDFQGQTAVQLYDGSEGWKLRSYLGRTLFEPFTSDELKIAATQQDMEGLLINADKKGSKIALEGMDSVVGQRAFRLKVTLRDGGVRHVWVDAKSFLEVKVDGQREVGGRLRSMSTLLRDYRRIDGVMMPFVMETTADSLKTSEKIVIEKVTINTDLPDSRFVKPVDKLNPSS